jgi:hypothetical protein
LSRALIALLAVFALSACAGVDAHYLGGEDVVPVDAGSVADTGSFPFDLPECAELEAEIRATLQDLLLRAGPDAGVSEYCRRNPFQADCPFRDLLLLGYDCAGRIRQQFVDDPNALR